MAVKWSGNAQNIAWWDRDNWEDTYGGQWINGVYTESYVPQDINYASVIITGTEENPTTVDYDASKSQEAATQVGSLEIGDNATLTVSGVQPSGQYAFNVNNLDIAQGGELDINTTSQVFLGNNPEIDGLLKISNAAALIDSHSINGSGAVVLDNATLGSTTSYMAVGQNLTTVLENGSTRTSTMPRPVRALRLIIPKTTLFFRITTRQSARRYPVIMITRLSALRLAATRLSLRHGPAMAMAAIQFSSLLTITATVSNSRMLFWIRTLSLP